MQYKIDFHTASSEHVEAALCDRLEQIRLSRNITQQKLADEAGVSLRTIVRMEQGEGVSLDTFIRVLIALGIQNNLETLLPDPSVRPVERVGLGKERKRARPQPEDEKPAQWAWGDGVTDDGG